MSSAVYTESRERIVCSAAARGRCGRTWLRLPFVYIYIFSYRARFPLIHIRYIIIIIIILAIYRDWKKTRVFRKEGGHTGSAPRRIERYKGIYTVCYVIETQFVQLHRVIA